MPVTAVAGVEKEKGTCAESQQPRAAPASSALSLECSVYDRSHLFCGVSRLRRSRVSINHCVNQVMCYRHAESFCEQEYLAKYLLIQGVSQTGF